MNSKNNNDYQIDKKFITDTSTSQSYGAVRKLRRQLQREFAVSDRRLYGKNSIHTYCDYVRLYGYVVGDSKNE